MTEWTPSRALPITITWPVSLCSMKGERSSSGLLEWESINDAMEALAMMNHFQMKNPSKFPPPAPTYSYFFKLVICSWCINALFTLNLSISSFVFQVGLTLTHWNCVSQPHIMPTKLSTQAIILSLHRLCCSYVVAFH